MSLLDDGDMHLDGGCLGEDPCVEIPMWRPCLKIPGWRSLGDASVADISVIKHAIFPRI